MVQDAPMSRRTARRYIGMVVLVLLLFGGWTVFWNFAADKAQATLSGWFKREAEAGRVYTCGSESIGGYPFRIELACDPASALFRGSQPPLAVKTARLLVAAQVYDPTLLIGEFTGPITVADPGHPPFLTANWRLAQASVRGTPQAPERVALVFDGPTVDRVKDGASENLLSAKHLEIHGRMAGGSATDKPVIELALRLERGSLPGLHPAAIPPIDANIVALLRGLKDFKPKPWPQRFREIQAADGRIDITQARVQQGDTIAVGAGSLSLSADGHLQGQLRVTVAGLEPFLDAIGAQRMVQNSRGMDKLAGMLDRFSPGLGDVARQQAGANLSAGIKMLGEQTTLEGKPAVALPLRFDNGRVLLGPIPIGNTPALF
jgi:hypothetical protein